MFLFYISDIKARESVWIFELRIAENKLIDRVNKLDSHPQRFKYHCSIRVLPLSYNLSVVLCAFWDNYKESHSFENVTKVIYS